MTAGPSAIPAELPHRLPATARDQGLDGARAVAALAVLATHVGDEVGSQLTTTEIPGLGTLRTGYLVQELNVGVEVFFVISAFLVFRPFASAVHAGRSAPPARRFLGRRFWRIYPAYWLALAVVVVASARHSLPSLDVAAAHAALAQGWHGDWMRGGYGLRQAWTLTVEMSFYLLVPLYAWAVAAWARRAGPRAATLGGAVVLLAVGHGISVVLQYHYPTVMAPAAIHLGTFAWGVALAVVVLDPRWRERLARIPAGWWWAAAIVVFVVFVQRSAIDPANPFVLRPFDQLTQRTVHGVVAALVVTPLVVGAPGCRLLAWRPLARLGLWSYGFYLWHYWVVELLHDHGGSGSFAFWRVFAGAAVGAAALGAASWYLVERPAMRRLR
jgi:peptidoglycan/LPS O-acetylase OafA/YrhL